MTVKMIEDKHTKMQGWTLMTDGFKLEQSMIKEWIVDDLTMLLPALNDKRYKIFDLPEVLRRIRDNIETLYEDYDDS